MTSAVRSGHIHQHHLKATVQSRNGEIFQNVSLTSNV